VQEMYLSPRLLAAAGAPPCEGPSPHEHFTLRTRREPKKRLTSAATAATGVVRSAAHAGNVGASFPELSTGSDAFRARSGLTAGAAGGSYRRPVPTAATSMFAPASRKPASSGMAFFRDSGPKRVGPGSSASAKSFLASRNKKDGANKTMMIDVSEAAQLGTVRGEDLQKEELERHKQLEQDEKQRRFQQMVEDREHKKKTEADRKRTRDDDAAKRKANGGAKRARTDAPNAGREGVATPSPQEEPIHGF